MFDAQRIEAQLHFLRQQNRYRTLARSEGISFVHNDYLGLAGHPRLVDAGIWALKTGGTSHRGSRLLGGHSHFFEQAEEKLAAYFDAPAALFFSTGYLANLAAVQVMGSLVDHVVSDERNHASLIDAIRLTQKPKTIMAHNRWETVPTAYPELAGKSLLLVAESLYSMDGDLVAEDPLRSVWNQTPSLLLLDEAHAAGIFRHRGRGVGEDWRDWERMVVVVTFGKAFGASGAALLCSRPMRELLVNTARPFIYTTAPPPASVAIVSAAIDVLEEESWRREELWRRATQVRRILREANDARHQPAPPESSEWGERSPVIPFLIPGEDRALRFCESVRKSGIEVKPIRYPTVPRGGERVRISIHLGVTEENTENMAKEMVRQWMAFLSRESTRE